MFRIILYLVSYVACLIFGSRHQKLLLGKKIPP